MHRKSKSSIDQIQNEIVCIGADWQILLSRVLPTASNILM